MDFALDGKLAERYKSASQQARVVTEAWGSRNLYCLACDEDRLAAERAGAKVVDFQCRKGHRYQLKAKAGLLGRTVTNSAYEPKVDAIRRGEAPNYVFLGYDRAAWTVTQAIAIPGHFLTLEAVKPRNPLRATARRGGHVLSTILLDELPREGRIDLMSLSSSEARDTFQRFEDLRRKDPEARGWLTDVLRIVNQLAPRPGDRFDLSKLRGYTGQLQIRHPRNRHVEEKVRQQLQTLRDKGVIAFEARGHYRRL